MSITPAGAPGYRRLMPRVRLTQASGGPPRSSGPRAKGRGAARRGTGQRPSRHPRAMTRSAGQPPGARRAGQAFRRGADGLRDESASKVRERPGRRRGRDSRRPFGGGGHEGGTARVGADRHARLADVRGPARALADFAGHVAGLTLSAMKPGRETAGFRDHHRRPDQDPASSRRRPSIRPRTPASASVCSGSVKERPCSWSCCTDSR
jgi:hypothetical protein